MPHDVSTLPEAVLLDRDGTINVKAAEGDYVRRPADLVLLPGAAAAIRRLNDAGVPIFVVTNQRGVARGLMSPADLDAVHDRLTADLSAQAGATLTGIYSCPHASAQGQPTCDCRKPLPGLVTQALAEHPGWRPERAALVGDAASDIAVARAVGARAIRLQPTGVDPLADVTVRTLAEAVATLFA